VVARRVAPGLCGRYKRAWIVSVPAGAAPTAEAPSGETRQVTFFDERVGLVAWSPAGDDLLVTVDAGGNEHDQLYLVPVAGVSRGEPRALTAEPDVIHTFGAWSPDGRAMCYGCNKRHRAFFDVWVMDVFDGSDEARPLLEMDATLAADSLAHDHASLRFLAERAWGAEGRLTLSRDGRCSGPIA